MALVACEECGTQVSDKAQACTKCGCPVPPSHYESLVQETLIDDMTLLNEAESYSLEAQFILDELQANLEVYGSNGTLSGANPANVKLAIQYIDRSLENFPDIPKYLNIKALLLAEGLGQKDEAIKLLEKARELNPRDITIESNLNGLKSQGCFIATAAYGSPLVKEIDTLRAWRKEYLLQVPLGRLFISVYNKTSPVFAALIKNRPKLRKVLRVLLRPLVWHLSKKYPPQSIDKYR